MSEESPSPATVTSPSFRFVLSSIGYDCVAAVIMFSLVAVGAVSSMGDAVGFRGELLGASPEDGTWEFGGVAGRLGERMEEMDMVSKGIVVGLADCCTGEFCGCIGNDNGGVGSADMLGDDGWGCI